MISIGTASAAQPTAFDNWAKTAKIGGAVIYVGMSESEMSSVLDTLVAQNVTVVEADSDLSNYQTGAKFELERALMRQFAETLPTDYNGGTIYGLDAGFLKDVEGLTEVWEIDTMSNNVGMLDACSDDWILFIAALKYARGAAGKKPSWTFSYGMNADDAQQVMAQALITGNNPYELKVPEMATTVVDAFRTRMFNWSKVNSPYLFKADSTATTGILFSSPSRDYVDQFQGLGMFATTDGGGDDLWWSKSALDSVYKRDYLGEHRGVLKMLVNEHIPFNVLVVPDQAELNQYQTVFMHNIQAISDSEAQRLLQYVQQGGQLIVTSPNPTGINEYGIAHSNYTLADLFGFSLGQTLPSSKVQNYGSGKTHYFSA